ncbi:dihydroxyacetone kinase subunit L [Alkalihalobacillus sp. LMS6]|uniref:dihydroxyacetone kinase subunit DhaL n=1 Tax=Alkalihalobacillus sp. LMS6 TaxID=2924034 RepID=UPI0020D06FDC|nr:dihydroxyacetone kinase subunit DhaL [Alkalihalobacillus sp. LMS6]UTR07734.1 dihydroxyacetone kinase subunit L [Alkalihalobacillus sp. LMS6]
MKAIDFKNALIAMQERMVQERDYLCELDRQLGDGDHGVTMVIGWKAIGKQVVELTNETDISVICKEVAMTFLNAVGSSVGPLYATGFLQAGKGLKGVEELSLTDVKSFWIAFSEGIEYRGGAKIGDKTMVDTLAPLAAFLRDSEKDFDMDGALAAAREGMESTKQMHSNVGRSSRLGDRSVGAIDPGAASAFFLFETFCESIRALEKV